MKKIIIILVLAASLAACIQGFSQIDPSLIMNKLSEKGIFVPELGMCNQQIESIDKGKKYPGVSIYDFKFETPPISRRKRIAIVSNEIYVFPENFNQFITDANIISISQKETLAILLDIIKSQGDELGEIVQVQTEFDEMTFDFRVRFWKKENGIEAIWYFRFLGDRLSVIREEIISVFSEDFTLNEEVIIPGNGTVNYFSILPPNEKNGSRAPDVLIRNNLGERINFSDTGELLSQNVVVQENQVATSAERRTVTINVNDWGSNQRVRLSINLPDQPPIFVDTLTTNEDGNATVDLTLDANMNTGRFVMRGFRVTGAPLEHITLFYVYRIRTGSLPSEDTYKYRVFYANHFTNLNQDSINNIVAQKIPILTNVYEKSINQWGFPSPKTIDGDEYMDLYLGSVLNYYASRRNCPVVQFSWFFNGIPAIRHFVDTYAYNNFEEFMHAADCHEFLHSVQYTYPAIFCNWTGKTGNINHRNYVIEGQARFYQTVYLSDVFPADNPEFRQNSMYQNQSNRYIQGSGGANTSGTRKSIILQNYDYAIFWRFLFENVNPGGTLNQRLDLLRGVLRNVSGNNALTGGFSAFNAALSSFGGNYNSFLEAKKDFAAAIYLNDCSFGRWDPCPSDAFYPKPPIKSTGTIQGDCEKLERADLIPVSFGIDFHEYTIAADTIVKFVFDCDPDNDGAGSFHVNLLLFKNDNLVMELLSDVNSGTISWEIDNDEVDKVVVVVLRMDANEATQSKWDYKFEFIVLKLPLEITDINDVTCFGKNDGSATVQASGGTPPYTYNWSNGQTGPTATNMAEGIYYVTVKDEDDCYGVIEVEINQPQKLALRINGGNAVIPFCSNLGGEPPSITLTAFASRGTPPYTYSWAGGSLTVVSSGVYTCTVTDANGCTETARAFVLFVPIVCSFDPNDITGPLGYSENQWVSVNDAMLFTIRFENDPDFASAPAQTVLVDLPIDDNLNIYDFRLESFGFGNFVFQVPPNKSTHTERLDVRDSLGIFVDITAGINIITKKAFWLFESIDPTTGLAPQDANAGFLLVNDSLGRGEGFANFSIKPKIITQTGDSIQAQAFIYFDDNASVDTNIWENKIDALPPASSIDEVVQLEDSTYNISFVGQDDTGGSGLANFLLYVAEGSGSYNLYGEVSADTIMNFTPTGAISFSLFSLAKDNVGNLEPMKEVPDTILTFIVANAGIGGQICQDDAFQISGAFTNAPNYFWTGGDGVFDDELNLNPVYTPGENDIINGEVELCLNSSISADLPTAKTCLLLTINPLPDLICPDPVAICCTSDPMVLSFGSPEGGIYAGTGVLYDEIEDHYVFIPSCDQTGGKVVSYIYTDDNGCQKSCNLVIEVYSSPEVTGTNYVVCADYESFSFVADFNPSDGQFYPANNFEQGMSPGIHEFSYTFVNGPCVVSMPFSVTVNALPEISCTQNIEIPCNFGPYELSSCSPEEGSYSGNGVSYDSVSESYTFIPSCNEIGQYPITYEFSDANNCVKQAVFTITVTCPSEIAIFPEFEQVEIICEGEFLADLPSSSLNGITGNWQPEINNTETTTYTFTPDANLCATIATITIAVDPLPLTAGQISGLQIVCVDQTSVEYTVEAIEHATEYTWTLPLGAMGSSNTNSILINYPQGTVSGNVSVLGVNDCGEGTASILSVEVLYQPVDAQPIIGDAIVCQAQANMLYTVPVIDNATSYSWTLPEGATGSSNTNTILINFANDAESGTISVKGVNDCFEGLQSFLEITVNPLPAEAELITGEVEVCQGQQEIYYHIDEIEHATSYQWTLPTGASGTSSTNSIIVDFGVTAFSGPITVKGLNDCGESNISSLSIIVNPLPSQAGSINGDNIVCAGQETVVFSIPPISNSASYVWSLPTGATGSSDTNEIIVDFATAATSGEITVKGTNDCGEGEPSSLFVEVINQPLAAEQITGNQSVCQGQNSVLFSVFQINNATEYQWSLPQGATGNSTTNTILVSFGTNAISGEVSVMGVNTCFEGESSSLQITVNPLPLAAGIVDGENIVCQGQGGVVYSVPEIENATSYIWTLPSGASGTSTTSSILVNFGLSASSGNVSVRGQNDCGSGTISTLEVQVNPKPQTPTITLLANHVLRSSATFGNQWYNQNGMIPGAINQEYQVIENGQYYVIVTVLDCGSEPSETLVINNVGIEIFDGKITLKAYPNPFTDELILEVFGSHEKLEFDILNTARQIVTIGTFVGKTIINTAGFAAGVYVVKLSNGKSFEFVKVIKAY